MHENSAQIILKNMRKLMAAEKFWTESIWKSVRGTLFAFTGKARDCEDIKSRICFRTLRWWKK